MTNRKKTSSKSESISDHISLAPHTRSSHEVISHRHGHLFSRPGINVAAIGRLVKSEGSITKVHMANSKVAERIYIY